MSSVTNSMIVAWLEKCGMKNVFPVKVKLGQQEFNNAVRYNNPNLADNGTYIYVLADSVPRACKVHWQDQKGQLWYVAAYMVGEIKPEFASFHPFGTHFLLGQGENEDWFNTGMRGGTIPVVGAIVE